LTNDGELANRLTHPRFQVPKTYRAKLRGQPIDNAALRALRAGSHTIELTIHEGRNRQVRRMCQAVGHAVVELERTRFGPLALDGLAPGAHRRLANAEAERLRALARAPTGRVL
jgi:23S rRNA pseudouridine2605 synthase